MRYDDRTGYPIPDRPSNVHCAFCHRVFAAGWVPRDGSNICRDCRAEAAEAADTGQYELLKVFKGGDE